MTSAPVSLAPDHFAGIPADLRALLSRSYLEEEALPAVTGKTTPQAVLDALVAAGHEASALRVIAASLPPREGAWWAWVSARHATQAPGARAPNAAVHGALSAVEQWIARPDDELRRSAWDAGHLAGPDTPIGMVCAAVFLSGGSIAPPGVTHLPPPPGAAPPLLAGAVLLAASLGDPQHIDAIVRAFIAQGLEIVKRLGGWETVVQNSNQAFERHQQEHARATAPRQGA